MVYGENALSKRAQSKPNKNLKYKEVINDDRT